MYSWFKIQQVVNQVDMYDYFQRIIFLFKRLLLVLLVFFFARLFFYVFNYSTFAGIGIAKLSGLFLLGVRFDLSVIVYFNILFILIHIFPFGNPLSAKWMGKFLKIYLVIINSLLVFVDMSDAIYFHFTQKRSTADVFRFIFLSDDVKVLLPKFLYDYWYVPVFWIIIMLALWKIYPDMINRQNTKHTNKSKVTTLALKFFAFVILLSLFIVGGRGGLQLKPLTIIDASKQASAENIPLVLNTPFSIMTTLGRRELVPKVYFSEKKCQQIYPVLHWFKKSDTVKAQKRKNVVVLLLESFSREYIGFYNNYKGYTPFLDSLMHHAIVFDNMFSNGLRSIDAIPAIVTGIPALMNEPLITSYYSSNKMLSLPEILEKEGYYTAFFHGGTNGTMNFNGFASYVGFDDYFGRTEYNNDKDYDGSWGIYDEHFLQFVARKLNSARRPFFAFEFTLSSHYPYRIPDEYKGKFKAGPLKIHKVIRYTDFALRRFFQTVSKMPWYNNTLFILVADHPAQSVIPSDNGTYDKNYEKLPRDRMNFYNDLTGKYAIPLILFNPADNTPAIVNETVQQTDLFPSILDYVNYTGRFVAFGQSVFDTTAPHVAFQFLNGIYQITEGNYSLEFDGEKSLALYNNSNDLKHKNNLLTTEPEKAQHLEKIIKAVLQQYITRLRSNRLADTTGNLFSRE